ncbi:AdoMet_MTases domain containing protein [Burkholderiales bacterium]
MQNKNYLKKSYFESKKKDISLHEERTQAGYREISTLIKLGLEIGFRASSGSSFLDLGCADKFLQPACESEGWNYQGLDYDQVDFERDSLPVSDSSLDMFVSLAVIEHLSDANKFLNEASRVLKPGGLIYLSTPNFQLDFKNFYNDPTHVKPYTPTSIAELLKLHGFSNVATFPGLRCKGIGWYRGRFRFAKAYYLLPFRNDSRLPVPQLLRGHARSIFALARKPTV